ncbi:hypothetical protein BDQ12DRAFT_674011 [Crucibulum laeve]|uniref:Uncharacterized protein n=1 Tax=Crucibulum laeve TaxID=68775 RepID=A0A5C3MM68_9AGAR|nr:hypothetical protein BDQ12DRAFT_674011 [Crucibulum laeve]
MYLPTTLLSLGSVSSERERRTRHKWLEVAAKGEDCETMLKIEGADIQTLWAEALIIAHTRRNVTLRIRNIPLDPLLEPITAVSFPPTVSDVRVIIHCDLIAINIV